MLNRLLCFIGYHSWVWSFGEHGWDGLKHSRCKRCGQYFSKPYKR